MPDLGPTEIALLICLAPLVLASGFFSGSETALFGMSQTERMRLARAGTLAGRAVEALMSHQRMLLITILLGNMVVNVLYFVISSVLMLRLELGVVADLVMALVFLMLLVLLGEVMPKIVANTRRTMFAGLVAPPLLTVHGIIAPLRIILDTFVVTPLSRLTAPPVTPETLDERELRELLELSGEQGAIDPDEQRMLRDVIKLGRMKVRDVMTPRVRLKAVPEGASREEVIELLAEKRLTKLPVYRGDLDHIVGILHVKGFLTARHERVETELGEVDEPHFVPEMATLERLLEHFRATPRQSAIVVDEYGGTAGIVAIEDVVEEIVGDIVGTDEPRRILVQRIGDAACRISGEMNLHDWADQFDIPTPDTQATTLSGFIIERLGRPADVGDTLEIGPLRVEVESTEGALITSVVQRRARDDGAAESSEAGS